MQGQAYCELKSVEQNHWILSARRFRNLGGVNRYFRTHRERLSIYAFSHYFKAVDARRRTGQRGKNKTSATGTRIDFHVRRK